MREIGANRNSSGLLALFFTTATGEISIGVISSATLDTLLFRTFYLRSQGSMKFTLKKVLDKLFKTFCFIFTRGNPSAKTEPPPGWCIPAPVPQGVSRARVFLHAFVIRVREGLRDLLSGGSVRLGLGSNKTFDLVYSNIPC